jgi:predicted anti-sigma-YlaC factor YlaD
MECRQIQELLKSDYLDGEVSERDGKYIKEHLDLCVACRELEKEVQAQRKFFQSTKQHPVPGHVWQNIQNSIIMEGVKQEEQLNRGVWFRLKTFLSFPRPGFVLASTLAVVTLVLVLVGTNIERQQYSSKENSLEIVSGYNLNGASDNVITDLGTSIEQYFL